MPSFKPDRLLREIRALRVPALWRNQDYLLLWSGQVVSSLGSQVSQLALPLLILAVTHSPAQAGIVAALRSLPYLIFSLPAGALIDRWDRKRVMVLCEAGRALCFASLVAALAVGQLPFGLLYSVTLIEGTLFVFFNLSEAACLPQIVPKDDLPAATAQNIATFSIASLVGGPLGGALYSASRVLPFLADALSYGVSMVSLLWIRTTFQEQRTTSEQHMWADITEGLSWLWHQPLIRTMALLTGWYNLIASGYGLMIIVLLQHRHTSPFLIGVIFAAGGIGGIVGAAVAPLIRQRFRFGQVIGGSCWLVALLWPFYAIAPSALLIGVITALFFLFGASYDVVQFSYRIALIPDALQGRVNSVFRLIAFVGQPLGLVITGALLQTITVIPTIMVFAAGYVLLALAATLDPHIRRVRYSKGTGRGRQP